ncbi:MAG: hypothetical protein H0V88_00645 [Pyrinomonadaceae bacterium]|nr:hypothetical protein [Pyrinomonadaceae bacterium]
MLSHDAPEGGHAAIEAEVLIKDQTKPDYITDARRINEMLDAHDEWLCSEGAAKKSFALRRGEYDLRAERDRLLFSCWGERGARVWRILSWERAGEKLLLKVARRMNAEHATLVLMPRASSVAYQQSLTDARRALCDRLAALASNTLGASGDLRIERASLSRGRRRGEPGRYARILLRGKNESILFTAPVVELHDAEADAFLASALLWFSRLNGRLPAKLCLAATRELATAVSERCALLRDELRNLIRVYETDDSCASLTLTPPIAMQELLADAPPLLRPARAHPSDWARQIIELAPEAIDVVRARRGETLRFHGLGFARVRRVMKKEFVWFGVRGITANHLLDENNFAELLKLLDELKAHRRAEADDHAHALYRAAPEAWLESLLRRRITQLDPGLILSPLHAQFRLAPRRSESEAQVATPSSAARPADLLALRNDGRLVLIELKVSEDVVLPLQAADYWRRVEAQRRCGNLQRIRLFDEKIIANEPSLVYTVAPTLRFHRQFATIARSISPEIELYRFDINEDWRTGVRVMRRVRVN